MAKHKTSFELSQEARDLLVALAKDMGLSQVSTLEVLIRDRAKREGLRAPATPNQETRP